jgi:hypothetical protein
MALRYLFNTHLGMFRWIPIHVLIESTTQSCVSRSFIVDATRVASSAHRFLDNVSLFEMIV